MVSIAFIALTLSAVFLFYHGTGKDKRVLALSAVWMLGVGVVAFSGYFTNTSANPPRFLIILFGAFSLSVVLYRMVKATRHNTKYLLAIHTLRFPVELLLYQLFLQRKVPVLMTFKGWNFDIVMGASALFLLLYLLVTKKKLANPIILMWNILGLFFLLFVVSIAILSSPLPLQQLAFDQPNVAVLHFPVVYLPAYIVPVVFLSHILLLRSYQKKVLLPPRGTDQLKIL